MTEKKIDENKIYRQNSILLAIICICIIIFIGSAIMWMVTDKDFWLYFDFAALIALCIDFTVIIKRRKKGIYLLTDEDIEAADEDMRRKKAEKEEKRARRLG